MKAPCFFIFLSVLFPLLAQPPGPDGVGGPGPGAPDRNRPGPWDNDVWVYATASNGTSIKLATFERAGVPTLARLQDGRIMAAFQHFPQDDQRAFDRVAVCFSRDEGKTWTKAQPIAVEGMDKGLARPFDPTLVPLPDGRVRLYFTSNRSPDFRRSTPAIYSAVSKDHIQYVFEPGVRFGIEGRIVIDCAAALHDGVFHLIVPDNGTAEDFTMGPQQGRSPPGDRGYHAISTNGLDFKRVADLELPSGRKRWLGNVQSQAGQLVFFGTGDNGVWRGTSLTGEKWTVDSDPLRVQGADPGAVKLRDDGWLLAVTGPPRPGTASERTRPRRAPPGQERL